MSFFNNIKQEIAQNKKILIVVVFGFVFLSIAGISLLLKSQNQQTKVSDQDVLGASQEITPSPTEIPSTLTNTPTPTLSKKIISTPTHSPTSTPTNTPTPTPTSSTSSSSSTSTPSNTSTPTPTDAPTPSPTPIGLSVQINIDYAGKKSSDSSSTSVDPGSNAFDAVKKAIGVNNISTQEFSFGIFINGFYGIIADPASEYYQFKVNGQMSDVGVSDYNVKDGDILDFVLASF